MAKLDFYFNGKKVNEDIRNWRDLEIEMNFQSDSDEPTVRTGNLEFVGDLAKKINDHNTSGLFAGVGILEAPDFSIEVCGGGYKLFEGGINTADCETQYNCDEVHAALRVGNNADSFRDRKNSFSFAYLASLNPGEPGRISQSDYVLVPYVINTIPDGVNIITGIISLFVLVKELQQAIEKTASIVTELIGDITPTVGVGATIAAGAIIADILKLILYLVYVAIMVVAIIDLTDLVFQSLIQPTKYKKGIRVYTLFLRACEYLGMDFTSSILEQGAYSRLVIIPKKTATLSNPTKGLSFVKSVTGLLFNFKQYDDADIADSYGYFEGTFGDLILAMNDVFNAKTTIIQGVNATRPRLYYERVDFFNKTKGYVLPNINYEPHYTNLCELPANYFLTYAIDEVDTNTYDLYEGNNCQHILTPQIINKKGNVLLKGIEERRLIFSLVKAKDKNNAIEDIFNVVYFIANLVYDIFNIFVTVTVYGVIMPLLVPINVILDVIGVPGVIVPTLPPFPPNPIGSRKDMMMLSSDFIGTPKLLLVDSSGKVSRDNDFYLSASALIDRFHYVIFIICNVDSNGNFVGEHNQWVIYRDKEIPLCCRDFIIIAAFNNILTSDGKLARIDSLIWNPYKETARITFRVKQLLTHNLKQQYLINKN